MTDLPHDPTVNILRDLTDAQILLGEPVPGLLGKPFRLYINQYDDCEIEFARTLEDAIALIVPDEVGGSYVEARINYVKTTIFTTTTAFEGPSMHEIDLAEEAWALANHLNEENENPIWLEEQRLRELETKAELERDMKGEVP